MCSAFPMNGLLQGGLGVRLGMLADDTHRLLPSSLHGGRRTLDLGGCSNGLSLPSSDLPLGVAGH